MILAVISLVFSQKEKKMSRLALLEAILTSRTGFCCPLLESSAIFREAF